MMEERTFQIVSHYGGIEAICTRTLKVPTRGSFEHASEWEIAVSDLVHPHTGIGETLNDAGYQTQIFASHYEAKTIDNGTPWEWEWD